MKKSYRFELCAETLEAAIAAERGGADRLELCTDLRVSGLTPSPRLLAETLQNVTIPVHVLIRPRAGNFVYSDEEFALMARQIDEAKAAGAHGIAVGILLPNGRIDVPRTRQLARRARPMHVTFHRAFDEVAKSAEVGKLAEGGKLDEVVKFDKVESPGQFSTPREITAADRAAEFSRALEDVIRTGADTLLTSGGAPNVLEGAAQISRLQSQAGDRLEIMAGGGLKLTNLAEVVQRSAVTTLHGSLSRVRPAASKEEAHQALVDDIKEAIRLLQQDCLEAAG
jgi:copper homeostasis protein